MNLLVKVLLLILSSCSAEELIVYEARYRVAAGLQKQLQNLYPVCRSVVSQQRVLLACEKEDCAKCLEFLRKADQKQVMLTGLLVTEGQEHIQASGYALGLNNGLVSAHFTRHSANAIHNSTSRFSTLADEAIRVFATEERILALTPFLTVSETRGLSLWLTLFPIAKGVIAEIDVRNTVLGLNHGLVGKVEVPYGVMTPLTSYRGEVNLGISLMIDAPESYTGEQK